MISKLVSVLESEFTAPVGVMDKGSYNKMPEPWEEVTRDFYFHWGTMWVLRAIETRQITPNHTPELFERGVRNGFFNVRIEWYWWGGVAVHLPRKWHIDTQGRTVYDGEIRYFRIGCNHDFRETHKSHRTLHHTECSKCGMKWSYDSGD